MIDFDSIRKQRAFENVSITATMPAASAELINSLLARFQDDPERLALVREMVLVEGAKAVLAQLGGEARQAKRGRKPKTAKAEPQPAAVPFTPAAAE